MASATVGKWGKNLAVRFPSDVVKAAGLADGERVEVEAHGDAIVIRRAAAAAAADALAAAEEIINESRQYPLGDTAIRELLNEGRRE